MKCPMPVYNASDIPNSFLVPYTQWVLRQLPLVERPLHYLSRVVSNESGKLYWESKISFFHESFEWELLRYDPRTATSAPPFYQFCNVPKINAFVYRSNAIEGCRTDYAPFGESVDPTVDPLPEACLFYVTFQQEENQEKLTWDEHRERLHIRLYTVTAQIGAAMGYFGRPLLPEGAPTMSLFRQPVVTEWAKEGRLLLDRWRSATPAQPGPKQSWV